LNGWPGRAVGDAPEVRHIGNAVKNGGPED